MVMQTNFVKSTDGTQIAYVTSGSGPPLIFAHGASGDKYTNTELQDLLKQKFTVTAYDRRGRGESSDHPDYNFLKEADDLCAVVSTVNENPVVFGISMGARIVFEMLRNPPNLSAAVLFEAPATNTPEKKFIAKLADVREELEKHGNEAATILHSKQFHGRSEDDIRELQNDPHRWKLRVESFPITLREMEAVHRDCLFNEAEYLSPGYPVELISGDATLPFLKNSRDLMALLPFVRSTILPDGNHSLPVNKPLTLFNALENVLSE